MTVLAVFSPLCDKPICRNTTCEHVTDSLYMTNRFTSILHVNKYSSIYVVHSHHPIHSFFEVVTHFHAFTTLRHVGRCCPIHFCVCCFLTFSIVCVYLSLYSLVRFIISLSYNHEPFIALLDTFIARYFCVECWFFASIHVITFGFRHLPSMFHTPHHCNPHSVH